MHCHNRLPRACIWFHEIVTNHGVQCVPTPESEPETDAVQQMLVEHNPLKLCSKAQSAGRISFLWFTRDVP